MPFKPHLMLLLKGLLLVCLSACSTIENTQRLDNQDPWQGWNRKAQKFNDGVDRAILKPMARGYQRITNENIDQSITNFFSNINDINVFVNDFLQLKFSQAGMDTSRFVLNSTFGMAGAFDVASTVNLPKHNEDFGQTLGFLGVPSGPYLVLPIFGASSPRDALGLVGNTLLNPLTYVSIFGGSTANAAMGGVKAVNIVDKRADLIATEKVVNEGAVDRYEFIKSTYQQRREYLIHDGHPLEDGDVDDEESNTNAVNSSTARPH